MYDMLISQHIIKLKENDCHKNINIVGTINSIT